MQLMDVVIYIIISTPYAFYTILHLRSQWVVGFRLWQMFVVVPFFFFFLIFISVLATDFACFGLFVHVLKTGLGFDVRFGGNGSKIKLMLMS